MFKDLWNDTPVITYTPKYHIELLYAIFGSLLLFSLYISYAGSFWYIFFICLFRYYYKHGNKSNSSIIKYKLTFLDRLY